MAHNQGGSQVKTGFYWSPKAWEMTMVPAGGGTLPGSADHSFVRIPTVLFLLLAPIMGAGYVFFLPFVGFVLLGHWAARKAGAFIKDAFMHIAVAVSPHWAPGEAYLASRRQARAARETKALTSLTDKVDHN
jgi:hypothetical protein